MKNFKILYNSLKNRIKIILQNPTIILLKVFKENLEKGNKKKRKMIEFCLFVFLFYFIFSLFMYVLRLCIEIKKSFYAIFPHYKLSGNTFYEKYGCNINDLNFFQRLKIFWLDFVMWDPYTLVLKFSFLSLILFVFYLLFVFIKKQINKMKSKNFIVIRNTDIKENLLFYHFVTKYYIEKMSFEPKCSFEEFYEIKNQIVENVIELYYIVNTQSSTNLLDSVLYFKNEVIKDLIENPNEIQQMAFDNLEKKHLIAVLEFLEQKKENKEKMPLEFEDFVNKFSEFRISE